MFIKKNESNIFNNGKQKHFNITKSYTFSLYENNTKGISLLNLWNGHILYINLVSLLVYSGRYILNPCEQGVVFVFNFFQPSWTSFANFSKFSELFLLLSTN
jgi:hypothetical protein